MVETVFATSLQIYKKTSVWLHLMIYDMIFYIKIPVEQFNLTHIHIHIAGHTTDNPFYLSYVFTYIHFENFSL